MAIRRQKNKRKEKEKRRPDWVEEYRGSLSNKAVRQYFRGVSARGFPKLVRSVERIRQRMHPSRYPDALDALLTTSAVHIKQLFPTGQRKFGDLGNIGEPFAPLPLGSELLWAAHWLSVRSPVLSQFRVVAKELSELVGQHHYSEALQVLESFRVRVGYSFWLVELQIALTQLAHGPSEMKELVNKFRKMCTSDSIPGFVAYLLGDRNDEALSYEAFYTRCKENIPRMNMDDWLKSYMLYRGLQHYELSPSALGQNLRNERRSTVIDLYETFIETCITICTSHELRRYRSNVLDAVEVLADVDDTRLLKIKLYAGGGWPANLKLADGERSAWSDLHSFLLYRGGVAGPCEMGSSRAQLHSDLAEVWNKGSGADKAVSRLLKFGVNLKSLDIGIAIASHAERQSSKTGPLMLIAAGTPFCLDGVSIEEIYGAPVDLSRDLLVEYVAQHENSEEGRAALNIVDGGNQDLRELSDLGRLWIASFGLANGKYGLAKEAADELRNAGPRWLREATKHQFVSAYTRGDLKTACSVLAESLTKDRALSVELPITEMFLGKKWKDFAQLDPIQVGIAAHYAVDAPASSPVGFILSSCCRSIQKSGLRKRIDDVPDLSMPEARLRELVLFFGEVWDENVLARTGAFDTTHDVRVERLKVVRRLLDWDKGNEDEYKSVIKELTVDDTLWQGVKHFNETRVFVNEPAITRWAEKELFDEFKRWREMMNLDAPAEEVTEAKVLEYLSASMDSIAGVVKLERPTEVDALFVSIVSRLLNRFLTDPTDGLNCYLSVRVRHGSLLRALFGPSEAIDLLFSDDEEDEMQQLKRVSQMCGVNGQPAEDARTALLKFSKNFRSLGERLIGERVQLVSDAHPEGLFRPDLNYSSIIEGLIQIAKISNFAFFVESCYFVFWRSLSSSLESARNYMSVDIKEEIAELFARLQQELKLALPNSPQFIADVTQAGTLSSAACDQTAGWFQLPNKLNVLTFELQEAVEVARRVSQTLNPGFEPILEAEFPKEALPLASIGLSTVVDCLLVILDNVFEHAGVGNRPTVKIVLRVERDILWLQSSSPLSPETHCALLHGGLAEIEQRLSNGDSAGLASEEGGSGLAKMKRLTKSVVLPIGQQAFSYGVRELKLEWTVCVGMKLHRSEGNSYYVY